MGGRGKLFLSYGRSTQYWEKKKTVCIHSPHPQTLKWDDTLHLDISTPLWKDITPPPSPQRVYFCCYHISPPTFLITYLNLEQTWKHFVCRPEKGLLELYFVLGFSFLSLWLSHKIHITGYPSIVCLCVVTMWYSFLKIKNISCPKNNFFFCLFC